MISIDASIFLGMHCHNDSFRIYCKTLVVNYLFNGIIISCEEIGKCDNIIWTRAASSQIQYFAFMDLLMTEGKFQRHIYTSDLIERAFLNKQKLSVELANALSAKHYSINSDPSFNFENTSEPNFTSDKLNKLYINSLNTKFEFKQLLSLID